MSKKVALFTLFLVLGLTTMAFAAEAGEKAVGLSFFAYSAFAAAFAVGVAGFGCGIGMGNAINGAVGGIARNPDSSGKVTVTMLIGLALIESLAIYALVVALILIYANPVSTMIQGFVGLTG